MSTPLISSDRSTIRHPPSTDCQRRHPDPRHAVFCGVVGLFVFCFFFFLLWIGGGGVVVVGVVVVVADGRVGLFCGA